MPQIRHLVTETFRSVAFNKIDPTRANFSFELFGFDFMLDEDYVVYLIEANTNPCLETNSAVLSRLIPALLDSTLTIAVDPLVPPPDLNFKRGHEALHENKFTQVFDEAIEGETLKNLAIGGSRVVERDLNPSFILADLISQSLVSKNKDLDDLE